MLEECGNEIRVSIPHIFFEQSNNSTRRTEYWTYKHAVLALDILAQQHISSHFFPEPISLEKNNNNASNNQLIVTLLSPYHDQLTGITYSAGTRFVAAHKPNNTTIEVYAYSSLSKKIIKIVLPLHRCLVGEPPTQKEKINLFVSLVYQWAQQQHGVIPYIWGGCSFTATCKSHDFIKKENAYYRPHCVQPASGFDCTGIIARATQICNIPYFFKNTTTLIKYLRTINEKEPIENGDIIYFAGHAIIIVDVTTNTCVEARSYDHGFGKIHTTQINKLFAHMHILEDIRMAMFQHTPVIRLDSKGSKVQTIPSIKILKLSSVWQYQSQMHKA